MAFGETSKIVWGYKHIETHKQNFITVEKNYKLALGFVDGERKMVSFKNESEVDAIIGVLADACRKAIWGYTKELEKLFTYHLKEFLHGQEVG